MIARRDVLCVLLVASAAAKAHAQDARPDAVAVARDAAATKLDVLKNDEAGKPGSRLSVIATTSPSHGTLTIAPGGLALVYAPSPGFEGTDTFTYTATNALQTFDMPRSTLGTVGGTQIDDGYGSALAPVPGSTTDFYLLTDRGPNVNGANGGKVFAMGSFAPRICRFTVADGTLKAVGMPVLLRNSAGKPRTGLPNPVGAGGTGEGAADVDGKPLPADPDGLDSEGLAALPDGTFWVSDEYGPYMVHFAADGTTIEQISPFAANAQGRKLPTVLKYRIPNKGMEGITITPDGKRLVGIMQSPLANLVPEGDAGKSAPVRIVTLDLATDATHTLGATHQFLYVVDDGKFACSEIAAVSDTEFLVDERDGKFPGDPAGAAVQKKIYRISLAGATDVTDPSDGENGLLPGGKTIEALTAKKSAADAAEKLAKNGITPVAKTLVVDLVAEFTAVGALGTLYPHDKLEGIALVDGGRRLVVSNDNDFGITAGAAPPSVVPKALPTLPGNPADFTQLLFVDLQNLPAKAVTATVTVTVK